MMMWRKCRLVSAIALGGVALQAGGEVVPRVYLNPELRSAAPSRGKVDDDRPHLYTYGYVAFESSRIGTWGLGYWSDTALTRRLKKKFRYALYENDAIPFWRYTWKINDSWNLRNDVMFNLKRFEFADAYRCTRDFYSDICYCGRLDNSYLTPFTMLRRMLASDDRFDFRFGIEKNAPLWQGLSCTANVYSDGGNSEQVRLRYGRRKDGSKDVSGFNAMVCQVFLNYTFADGLQFYFGLEQFDILRKSARKRVRSSDDPWARCDLLIIVCGMKISL